VLALQADLLAVREGDMVEAMGVVERPAQPTRLEPRRGRVLLVGTPRGGGARLSRALARAGYQPVQVDDGAAALVRLRRGGFAAVLLADDLPGIRGEALLPGLRVAWPELPVIFVRRPGEAGRGAEAVASGAAACLVAPVRAPDLLRAIREAMAAAGGTGRPPHALQAQAHG
jgi:CheY-like chemotaxis protein